MEDETVQLLALIGIRVVAAAAAVFVGWVLARVAGRNLDRALQREVVVAHVGPSMRNVFVRAIYWLVLILTAAVTLSILGVPDRIIGYSLAAIVVILGLALRESIANFAATVIFAIFRPYRLGDHIETMGMQGVVQDMQLFNTVLHLFDGRTASLANNSIQEAGVINYSRSGTLVAQIGLTVGYGEDLTLARGLLHDLIDADGRILTDPPAEVLVTELTGEGVTMQVRPRVQPADRWPVICDLQEAIALRFAEHGVRLAAPPEADVRLRTEAADDEPVAAAPPRPR